jgi:hypothetical protein
MESTWSKFIATTSAALALGAVLCIPQQALAITCGTGYTLIGGRCVKGTAPPTQTSSQSTWYELHFGEFYFTHEEGTNKALLYETWWGGPKIYDFGVDYRTINVTTGTIADPNDSSMQVTQWEITSTDHSNRPSWLDPPLAVNITDVPLQLDPADPSSILHFKFYDGNFYTFLVDYSGFGNYPRPYVNPIVNVNGNIPYGLDFIGRETTLYEDVQANSIAYLPIYRELFQRNIFRFPHIIDLNNGATIEISPVPEPSTLLLLGGGLAALAGTRISRRKKNQSN